jgi:hypothetical protein
MRTLEPSDQSVMLSLMGKYSPLGAAMGPTATP